MYGKSTLSDYIVSLEPQPKQRYSEHLAFVPTEPFLTQLVQSCTIDDRYYYSFMCLWLDTHSGGCSKCIVSTLHVYGRNVNYVPPNLPVAIIIN